MILLDFFKYLIKSVVENTITDIISLLDVVSKNRTWVFICAIATVISLIFKNNQMALFWLFMFLVCFIAYEWQQFKPIYVHEQRELKGYTLDRKKQK